MTNPASFPSFRRRAACALTLALTLGLAVGTPPAAAQDAAAASYPDKPVRLIVAFAAGGAADVVMRKVGAKLGELLGRPVVVENRAGANGNIGADYVAKSKADGYTLLAGFPGLTSNPSLYKTMSFDPLADLVPIKMIAVAPVLLVATPGLKANSVAEVIALAKAQPNGLRFGSAGQGASGHLAGELFKAVTHVQMQHVPYKGGVLALNDLMSGQIELAFDSIPSSRALVEGKKLKALAIAGDRRSPALPDVPTFKEAGLAQYYANTWFGILAPKGTPEAVRSRLAGAISRLLNDPELQAELQRIGLLADNRSTEDFARFMNEETRKWSQVVKAANIQIE